MNWEATYIDESVYKSSEFAWQDLPKENFIKVIITLPEGGKMQVSGWDFYSLEDLDNGIKISFWKDTFANDIDGNPIFEPRLNQGGNRHFYNDGSSDKPEYLDASIIYNGIPNSIIKNGIWANDELAKKLGVL